ncbi:Coiled-coil domain-containing protein 81 [Acipenser ruthenus]|uniref:Coiled-coil domain-containing protein 81 n=1 Tax=Acipenser ruthenus TaxID=7906 RepID=A0A444UA25_ACIRT|nr:Coiled-coil domain-containing protein 81 [Acipenser ruthenus]
MSRGDVPVVQLNFTSLSLESPFDRDTVEGCVRETLLLLSRSVALKRNVLFAFHSIGVISIREGKVKMKFYRDFLNSMDSSGSLVKALSNRPGTCDSVLTARESQARPVTSNTVLLPSLAAQTEQHLRNKAEKTMNYQKALDAQVKTRAHGLPSIEPNSEDPVFGNTVGTYDKLLEQRRRAHELYRYQLEVSAKKRKDALLNRIVEQKKEQDILERNRKELIVDRVAHYDKLRSWRASLEETWAKTAEAKRQRGLVAICYWSNVKNTDAAIGANAAQPTVENPISGWNPDTSQDHG